MLNAAYPQLCSIFLFNIFFSDRDFLLSSFHFFLKKCLKTFLTIWHFLHCFNHLTLMQLMSYHDMLCICFHISYAINDAMLFECMQCIDAKCITFFFLGSFINFFQIFTKDLPTWTFFSLPFIVFKALASLQIQNFLFYKWSLFLFHHGPPGSFNGSVWLIILQEFSIFPNHPILLGFLMPHFLRTLIPFCL